MIRSDSETRAPARRARAHLPAALLPIVIPVLVLAAAGPAAAADNLMANRQPSRVVGVSNVKVITDGQSANEGDEWNTTGAALFASGTSFVEYDLGASVDVTAAYLQGDNNDLYFLQISEDGNHWAPLWAATPRPEPGLRERWSAGLAGHGRWLRLGVSGGDQAYSVSELELFSDPAATMPPAVRRITGTSRVVELRSSLLYLVAAFGVFLFVTRRRMKLWQLLLAAVVPLAALAWALQALFDAWPLVNREVSFVRAAAAAIALLAACRTAIPRRRWPAQAAAITAALAMSAVMAFAAFYNLGRPQFFNHAHDRPEFVHTNDLRVYQPFAKYFPELQYDGVYLASVLAYAEDQRGGSLASLGGQEVRGMHDHRLRRVRDIEDDIRAIRGRFSDERWAEFKRDMRYFEDVMGPDYLGTLTDHGANATPVWVFFARLVIGHAPASEGLLTAAGLIDGLLLLLMAVALWRAFGLWPALLAVTVFGANDLYMFGTNWSGATLRHDWLALLGFGAAALKRERWATGGVCLALSALIRAFPIVALLGVALPALWSVGEKWRRDRQAPSWRSLRAEHPETVRVLAAAAICALVMVALTSALYSFAAWEHWWQKVTLLNRDVGVNEVSLRALFGGVDASTEAAMRTRTPLFVATQLAIFGLVALLARRRPLEQAMIVAMPLVLVLSNPSNYYSHFVFLMALMATVTVDRGDGAITDPHESAGVEADKWAPLRAPFHQVALPLVGLCVGGYWVSLDPDLDRHFQGSTMLLFVALAYWYATLFSAAASEPVASTEIP